MNHSMLPFLRCLVQEEMLQRILEALTPVSGWSIIPLHLLLLQRLVLNPASAGSLSSE